VDARSLHSQFEQSKSEITDSLWRILKYSRFWETPTETGFDLRCVAHAIYATVLWHQLGIMPDFFQ
jgi:hypothetical protein